MAKINHGDHCLYDFDPTDKDRRWLICWYNKGHRVYIMDIWRDERLRGMQKNNFLKGQALREAEAITALDI